MRVTELVDRNGETEWTRYEADRAPLVLAEDVVEGIRVWQKVAEPWGRLEVVELDPGAELDLHGGEHFAFCQVVAGAGHLVLPGGEAVRFEAPELFVFEPDTEHGWRDIERATVMTVCVVGATKS